MELDPNKLRNLSTNDLLLLQEGRLQEVSEAALRYLSGEEFGTGETLARSAERGFTSSFRGIKEFFGAEPDIEDLDKEAEFRMMMDTSPVAAVVGNIGGSIADVVTLPAAFLKPIKFASTVGTMAARGAVAGGVGGVIEPVYEDYQDSRLINTAAGAGFGAVLGTGLGVAAKWLTRGLDTGAVKVVQQADPETKTPLIIEKDGKTGTINERGDFIDEEGKVISTSKEEETKVLEELGEPEGDYRWNPQTQRVEVMEVTQPDFNTTLPRNLDGAKPRFNRFDTQFENGLDKALYIIGNQTSKSASHAAYVDWVKGVTGLDDAGVKALGVAARTDLVRALANAPEVNGKLVAPRSTTVDKLINFRTKPRVRPVEYQPKKTIVKTAFTNSEMKVLDRLGINLVVQKGNRLAFQNKLNNNKIMSDAEVSSRLRALGWEVDVSGLRKAKKAEAVPAQAAPTQAAEAVPTQATQAAEAAPTQAAQQPLDFEQAPADIGAPRQLGSVGSAGTRPGAMYGPEFMPKTAAKVLRGGKEQESFLLRALEEESMGEGDIRNVVVPKDAKNSTTRTLRAEMANGTRLLKKIIDQYGNMAEFMLAKKDWPVSMTPEEIGAFRWFHADAMKKRNDVLDEINRLDEENANLASDEFARLAEDLMYYSGIDLFWKNDGTKAARALNARKIITTRIENNKNLKSLFPGMEC